MDDGTTGERWAPIPGHEGRYEVSDQGRVRSLDRIVERAGGWPFRHRGRILRAAPDVAGYPRVTLGGGENRRRLVHHYVLDAFVGPRPDRHEARHLNGNPADARLANLRWGTKSENTLDRVRHGTHNMLNRTHCPQNHPLQEPNLVPAALRRGVRQCNACNRAAPRIAYRRRKGYPVPTLQEMSDQKYAELMEQHRSGQS